MDATLLPAGPDAPLPDDPGALRSMLRGVLAELARLRAENERLRAENEALRGQLQAANKQRFGKRSERQPRPERDPDKPARKARPHGRAALPARLERREVVYDLSEDEKRCPCCGESRTCIGEDATEQLEVEPVKFFVRRTVRRKYACRRCGPEVPAEQRFRTAGPAQVGPIPKGLPGPGLLALVLVAKYADHTPLNRLAGQLARSGVTIRRSTLGGWVSQAAALLAPLVALMRQRLLLSRVVHSDDTGVKLLVAGKGQAARAHLWAYVGDADYPYVVFDFTADYTAAGPSEFLKGYKGYLQADALAQYEGLYGPGRVLHCCCWAHARRKFVEARDGGDERAKGALGLIGRLYAVERGLPAELPPSDEEAARQARREREEERRRLRQERSAPVLAEMEAWLGGMRGQALPKSKLGQAVGYALNNWEALGRYTEQGYLGIDNNLSERTLRAIALGRANWGVIGSEAGGESAAVVYSVVGTCKHLGADPFAYLREALPGLFALGQKPADEQLVPWLPDRWLLARGRDGPPGPAAPPPPPSD